MSQKTNPLSLRLQKTNRNFDSPSYSDYFLTENSTYLIAVDNYTKTVFGENQYLTAFISTKSFYRKINVLIFLQQNSFHFKKTLLKCSPHSRSKLSLTNFDLQKKIDKNNLLTRYLKNNTYFNQSKKINNYPSLRNWIKQNKIKTRSHSLDQNSLIAVLNDLLFSFGKNNRYLTFKENEQKQRYTVNSFWNSIFQTNVYFEKIRFTNYNQTVRSIVDTFVYLLEKRVSFNLIKNVLFKQFIDKQSYPVRFGKHTVSGQVQKGNPYFINNPQNSLNIKGIRISCSGRIGGRSKKAQKAKMQSQQYGQISLNVFSSKVSFARKSAYTSFGKIGVKVWIRF
uniref:30S ribosomal protein S3 n=1 Tax=Jaagichlorella hainangensis TaxID=445995 RepID=A0A6M8U2Y4_9CHLO|nr:30S ribosomal protein S3 [Jaagichlorella hainangensis]QKJ84916.1 30S ribosomal protein S3 [Jaagichlorella hainangensis]